MILEKRTKEVDDSLRLKIHDGEGYRMVMRGESCIASDGAGDWARCAKLAADVPRGTETLAIIGGGLGVLPQLLRWVPSITVYEIEPSLEQFVGGSVFVAGDWRETLEGKYDVIVYDLGEYPNRKEMNRLTSSCSLLLGVPTHGESSL